MVIFSFLFLTCLVAEEGMMFGTSGKDKDDPMLAALIRSPSPLTKDDQNFPREYRKTLLCEKIPKDVKIFNSFQIISNSFKLQVLGCCLAAGS